MLFKSQFRKKNREFLSKCEEKQGQRTKERDKLFLFQPHCFLSTNKTAAICCQAQNLCLPLLPSRSFSGISFVVPAEATLPHLLLCLSLVLIPKSLNTELSRISILAHKSAVFQIFKSKVLLITFLVEQETWNILLESQESGNASKLFAIFNSENSDVEWGCQ